MKLSYPLENFLKRAVNDSRLLPTHLSLFMAIFHHSSADYPKELFKISRSKLMQFSRIKSIATYHKIIYDLVEFGYICYEPSFNRFKGSQIGIIVIQ